MKPHLHVCKRRKKVATENNNAMHIYKICRVNNMECPVGLRFSLHILENQENKMEKIQNIQAER